MTNIQYVFLVVHILGTHRQLCPSWFHCSVIRGWFQLSDELQFLSLLWTRSEYRKSACCLPWEIVQLSALPRRSGQPPTLFCLLIKTKSHRRFRVCIGPVYISLFVKISGRVDTTSAFPGGLTLSRSVLSLRLPLRMKSSTNVTNSLITWSDKYKNHTWKLNSTSWIVWNDEICGFHDNEYVCVGLLPCDAVWACRYTRVFRKTILPQSSAHKTLFTEAFYAIENM